MIHDCLHVDRRLIQCPVDYRNFDSPVIIIDPNIIQVFHEFLEICELLQKAIFHFADL